MSRIIAAHSKSIAQAAEVIKSGGLVGMPTETVYGLAANALDGAAVAKIFAAKGRPSFNPLISHFHSQKQAEAFAVFNEHAREVASALWPGPLTLILPRPQGSNVSELAMAGLGTIAVRVPNHPVALELLRAVDVPIVAPSANVSGALSPTTPAHVADGLGDKIDLILAAGACKVGLESTVLDLSTDTPIILRPGAVTAEDIGQVLGMKVAYHGQAGDSENKDVKSPGMLLKHYAPNTPVRLNAIDLLPGEALLAFGSDKFIGIKGGGAAKDLPDNMRCNLSDESDLNEAASNLFAMLKHLDGAQASTIAVMQVPDTCLGVAINDRLRRAAQSR